MRAALWTRLKERQRPKRIAPLYGEPSPRRGSQGARPRLVRCRVAHGRNVPLRPPLSAVYDSLTKSPGAPRTSIVHITDATHFLDAKGVIGPQRGPGRKLQSAPTKQAAKQCNLLVGGQSRRLGRRRHGPRRQAQLDAVKLKQRNPASSPVLCEEAVHGPPAPSPARSLVHRAASKRTT